MIELPIASALMMPEENCSPRSTDPWNIFLPRQMLCTFTSYGLYTWPHTSGVRHFSKTLILLNGDGKRIKISQANGSLYGQHSQNYQKSSKSVGVILIWDVLGDVNVVKLCFHVPHSASVADFVKSLCNLWKYT